eukprot:c7709_g1_i1.p1 GENE.c7709_g1_i1~~c7709_g1_i1.p1  ORF type:complete len:833 (+),score=252.12 c7709_g1_i1:171-2669(+)
MGAYSNFLLKHSTWILLFAVISTAGVAIFGFGAFGRLATQGFEDSTSESYKTAKLFAKNFDVIDSAILAVLEHPVWGVDDVEFRNATMLFVQEMSSLPIFGVMSYISHPENVWLISDNRMKALVTFNQLTNYTGTITKKQLENQIHGNPLEASFFDRDLLSAEIGETILQDLVRAEISTLPIVLIFVILTFQGVVAAAPAFGTAAIAIVWSLALLRLTNMGTDVSEFAINVVTLTGLGVSIDYSLFIILRFREERMKRPKEDVTRALDRVIATSVRTVLFSAITVAFSLTGTFFFNEYYVYSMGLAIIFVVVIAAFASCTVLLTILVRFDKAIFRLSTTDMINYVHERMFTAGCRKTMAAISPSTSGKIEDGWWYRATLFSIRFAIPLCVLIIAGLAGLLSVFVSEAVFGATTVDVLPESSSVRHAADTISNEFTLAGRANLQVYLETKLSRGVWTADFLTEMDKFATAIEQHHQVSSVSCMVRVGPPQDVSVFIGAYAPYLTDTTLTSDLYEPYFLTNMDKIARVSISLNTHTTSKPSKEMVRQARILLTSLFRDANGTSLLQTHGVAGLPAVTYDLYLDIGKQLPKWFATMMVTIFVLITAMTRSVVLPLKAIATALLSLAATLGVLVLVFQKGHGHQLLNFTSTGDIDGLQLIFIFSLAFGLSMDYELFILGRVQESYEKTHDLKIALATGIQGSGRAVTMAAVLLAIVMASFISSSTSLLKMIGLGVALSIVVDATIVRTILVPGLMSMMGKWNWWAPQWLQRLLMRLNIAEQDLQDEADADGDADGSKTNSMAIELQHRDDNNNSTTSINNSNRHGVDTGTPKAILV